MGLDTTHDCYHGPYSSFNRWRNEVARAAGYKIVDDGEIPVPDIDWNLYTMDNIDGKWKEPPADPLIVLIVHSDCDGSIHPKEAKPLADRLSEILPLLDGGPMGLYREKTETFIKGLRLAHKLRQRVRFG